MNKKHVNNLIEKLTDAEHDYYVLNKPIMSDGEYDNLSVQTRYNSDDVPCNIEKVDESTFQIELKTPTLGVAPGQFGVIYQDTKLVGGGRITSKVLEEVYE